MQAKLRKFIPQPLLQWLFDRKDLVTWLREGKPLPAPPVVKQRMVAHHARTYRLKTLIETGTFLGQMVQASRRKFERIISIELDEQLHAAALYKFGADKHIELLQGNSGEVLARVVQGLDEPCLFWLDAHYSGGITAKGSSETPIMDELSIVLGHPARHVILIDDARLFVGANDYPTLDQLRERLERHGNMYKMSVHLDVIQIIPQ